MRDALFAVRPGQAAYCTLDRMIQGWRACSVLLTSAVIRTTTRAVCRTNRYSYNGHVDLTSGDLFFWIAVGELHARLGLDDLAAAAAVLLGQGDVPAPGKFATATKGTSVVSIAARKLLPIQMKMRLPMILSVSAQGVRIASTKNLGAWVGRTIPVIGEVFLATDAAVIMFNTVRRYNAVAKPEDRVF
nr:hypothetical protein [Burkholderia puraquae]